jgi:hypothetical protein
MLVLERRLFMRCIIPPLLFLLGGRLRFFLRGTIIIPFFLLMD